MLAIVVTFKWKEVTAVLDLLPSISINKMYFFGQRKTKNSITLSFVDGKMKYWHNLSTPLRHFRDGVCLFGQSG
jgi:hypothetical protein